MNKKEDILNSWITIEQLSEGSIDIKDKALKSLDTMKKDWKQFFLDFLENQKKERNISDEDFEESGVVLYFGIFDFEEVIDILRKRYKLKKTNEETSKSKKFTFAIYFDNELNIKAKKLFLTMSGYIREHGDLPEDFLNVENLFREDINKKFKGDFNKAIFKLFENYNVSEENFRYKFLKNIETGDVNLHSFFINDLKAAKKISSKNLNRYFNGFSGERKNLDSNKESKDFNAHLFEEIALKPKFYPLGRFPSNSDYALSFMQQGAVNLALNDKNNIRSVNGPPGTGKTTLLKDIFADLVVQQALEISNLSEKKIKGSMIYYKEGKVGFLPQSISDKNIVVASSNNGAVQNIVKELPKTKEISEEFQSKLIEADYFKEISNTKLKIIKDENGRRIESKLLNDENWGVFSLEGGASMNIERLLLNIEMIESDLKNKYTSNTEVYEEFLNLYNRLKAKRDQVEKYSKKIYCLRKLKDEYIEEFSKFEKDKNKKQIKLSTQEKDAEDEQKRLIQESERLEEELAKASNKIKTLSDEKEQAKRNYDVIVMQKPSFLWLKKIFNKSKVNQYFKDLNRANDQLKYLSKQESELLDNNMKFKSSKNEIDNKINDSKKQINNYKSAFNRWKNSKENKLEKLKREIELLDEFKSQQEGIEEIDFSLSYEELQKSNPWFKKEFRILQTELFILALKVRKQFIYENIKNIKAARIIWSMQDTYKNKENGQQLILEAWQWINFTVPIISTTFASFGRMFRNLGENSIANVFIDEAGQALPQASIGAVFRSKRVMAVGDPSQIKPVLTLDSNVLDLIARNYKVNEKFVSANASTQTIIDDASQYGFQKGADEWIGIPLWVHRRSNYPMFTISNKISYEGLMVQGKNKDEAQGKSQWLDCTGNAEDKYVKEQGELLKGIIAKRLKENPKLANDIYVISPFKNVADKLTQVLDEINFTKRQNDKATNIGTVHTFQGKEAKIVYFVLGADKASKNSAKWAVAEPNIMNVAATRAKEEFYIIGDKELYASLNTNVAYETIRVIDNYNK